MNNKEGVKREPKIFNNEAFKERFQFLLWINDDIVCQRYFKCYGYNAYSIESIDFKEECDDIVGMIQDDLVSKSRVYSWYTKDDPLKMKGFSKDVDSLDRDDISVLINPSISGDVILSNGEVVRKEYCDYSDEIENWYVDKRVPEPYEVTFKFQVIIDENVVYERIWDGGVYPKYVRSNVDLSNSSSAYEGKDPVSLHFTLALQRAMTVDKVDLIYHIIKRLCKVMTYRYDDNAYTKKVKYGDREYSYTNYLKEYVDGYKKWISDKHQKWSVNNELTNDAIVARIEAMA